MANSDILITNAGAYRSPFLSAHQRKVLLVYSKLVGYKLTVDYTTAAGVKTITQIVDTALKGVDDIEPSRVAVWMKNAEGADATLATNTTSAKLLTAGATELSKYSDAELDKLSMYMEGLMLAALA